MLVDAMGSCDFLMAGLVVKKISKVLISVVSYVALLGKTDHVAATITCRHCLFLDSCVSPRIVAQLQQTRLRPYVLVLRHSYPLLSKLRLPNPLGNAHGFESVHALNLNT